MKTTELQPCPFCGSKPEITFESWNHYYWLTCCNIKCGVNPQTNQYTKKSVAIAAWNRRKKNDETSTKCDF